MKAACRLRRAAACATGIAALTAPPVLAGDVEITGTAYTITYRGPGGTPEPVQPAARPGYRPPPRVPLLTFQTPGRAAAPQPLRLVNGRSGVELARASYDSRIDGWMFQLPLAADVSRLPLCLVVKGPSGTSLPLRDERAGDDGFAFRNPMWESEVVRMTELTLLRRERETLMGQLEARGQELDALRAQVGAGPCVAPAAESEPARPAGAMTEAQARAAAGGVCALKWQQAFVPQRVDAGRLFADAGAQADWDARDAARPAADALGALRLAIAPGDFALVADAAVKGRNFLEHAEGVRLFTQAQAACRDEVPRVAQAAVAAWEQQVRELRQVPQRALAQCEARQARIGQIQSALSKSPAYRAELEQRIAVLAESAPPTTKPARLDREPCKDL